MSNTSENRHMSSGHTTARFITPQEREAGVSPDAVAAELAAQAAQQVASPDPHSIGQRGISVKVINPRGHQTAGAVETTQRAEVRNTRIQGAQAIELAKSQNASLRIADETEPVSIAEFARLYDALPDDRMRALLVPSVWVEVDVLGRVVSHARSLPSPSPSGAEGQGTQAEPMKSLALGADPSRAFARPGGPSAHVQRRNEVQRVDVRGMNQRVGATPGSAPGVRTYGATAMVTARETALAAVTLAQQVAELTQSVAEHVAVAELEPPTTGPAASEVEDIVRERDIVIRQQGEALQETMALLAKTKADLQALQYKHEAATQSHAVQLDRARKLYDDAAEAAKTAERDAANMRTTVTAQATQLAALVAQVEAVTGRLPPPDAAPEPEATDAEPTE